MSKEDIKTKKSPSDKEGSKTKEKDPRRNPWNSANPLSLLFFAWIWPIFQKGRKVGLEPPDLYSTPKIYESERLSEKFKKKWEEELQISGKKGKQPSLLSVILKICKRNFILYFIVLTFDELVVRVLQPITLRYLVKSFEPDSDISRRDQIIYGAVVCATTFSHNFVMEHTSYLMLRTGMLCRVSLSALLYDKILKLSPFARRNATTGKLTNLMANDLGRFDLGFLFIGYTIIAPIQFAIFVYFLWDEIGTGTLGGASVFFIIIPLQVLNGTWTTKFRENIAKQTDERSRIMNEIIMAVRVIKMMAWESPFAQLVNKIRKTEVKALGNKMYLKAFYLSMFTVCIKLTPFLTILWYVLSGHRITADKAFFVVAVIAIIIENMVYYFSIAIASVGEVWISISRLQEVLLMAEQKENAQDNAIKIATPESQKENDDTEPLFPEPSVKLTNAYAKWGQDEPPIMSNFNLNLEGDKLVMIVGAVGSGKSSFIHTLINELPLSSGELKINGSVTYASQEPWLFAGTVKENVVFGKQFNEQLYQEVIRVSALEDDLKQLPNGDASPVGERGMALSGGQKARINLARALYRDADIVILDDPLSAVDSRVSKHIFDKCIRKYLRGRLRILATHQLQYLPMADYVIVLKQGKILSQGTPTEIQNQELDLMKLLQEETDAEGGGSRRTSTLNVQEPQNDAIEQDGVEGDEEDSLVEGVVTFKTYWAYMRSGDSVFGLSAIIFLYALGQVIITLVDFWISLWTRAEENNRIDQTEPLTFEKPYWGILDSENYYGDRVYLGIYGVLVSLVIATALVRAVTCFRYFLQISVNLHNRMFNSLIRAPVKFFDDNPSGRIMNRFTKDIGSIDELLPSDLYDSVEYLLQSCGVVVIVVLSNYYLAIPAFIIVVVVLFIRHIFLKTSRHLKRIESQARSPVFSHLAATIQGITTIRSLKTQNDATQKLYRVLNDHTSPYFLFMSSIRFFTTWIATVSSAFLTAITITFMILSESVDGGLIGFVITSAISLTTNLQWALREAAEAENNMTSVARALEYTTLPSEAAWESSADKKPPPNWPSEGGIKFNGVSLAYDGETDVLKNVKFEIKPKEKVGIVGRTGAGKSTIIAALFRMTEPRGDIIIDDLKINDIGLHELRRNVSIIPQDPVLFSGSIRKNLDPFDQYGDADIWKALEDVKLNDDVSALDAPVEDGGANFSIGQRQLICLARAILRKNRIILMDEATANVDVETDAFIQTTIREKFKNCSIIIIAHRLQTVMDCDKILVMEKGSLMEYDHPHLLLQNEEGYLLQLVSYTGGNTSAQLKEIARKHYEEHYRVKEN